MTDSCDAHTCGHGSLAEHHPAKDVICVDHVSYRYPAATFDPRSGGDTPRLAASGGGASGGTSGGGASGGGTLALKDVTLHVEQGCNLGIIGPNGGGKTTLIKIMLGLLQGYTGSVALAGLPPVKACRHGDIVGYVPQRAEAEWRFPVTAEQVVRMGLVGKTGLLRWPSKADRDYVGRIMERVGVAKLAKRPVGGLSGGQQQRLFIARALAAKPKVLILDEPMVGIDEAGQQQFAQLIHELHQSLALTVVIVSHDLQAIAAGCNRVAVLKQTLHYHDAPAGLTREVLAEVFEHDLAGGRG